MSCKPCEQLSAWQDVGEVIFINRWGRESRSWTTSPFTSSLPDQRQLTWLATVHVNVLCFNGRIGLTSWGCMLHAMHVRIRYVWIRRKNSKRFQKDVFMAMQWKNHFWFPNEPFIEQFLKVPSYLSKKNILVIWKTFCTPFKVSQMLKVRCQ